MCPTNRSKSFRRGSVLVSVAFVLVFLTLFARRPDAILNPQLWAEDGTVFLKDQFTNSTWVCLMKPHLGYLQLLPRLIAAAASMFSVLRQPLIYNLAAMLVAAGSFSLFAHPRFRSLLESDAMRVAVCVLAGGIVYSDEIVGTITNLQWYLAVPIVLLILRPGVIGSSVSIFDELCLAGLMVLLVLSCPLAVIALPFAVAATMSGPGIQKAVPVAFLSAATAQFSVQLFARNPSELGLHDLKAVLHFVFAVVIALTYRVILSTLLGHGVAQAISTSGRATPVVIALASTGVGLAAFWRYRPRMRVRLIGAMYLMAASAALPMAVRGGWVRYSSLVLVTDRRQERYFFLASCCLIYLAALSVSCLKLRRGVVWLAIALLATGGAKGNFAIPRPNDLDWPSYAAELETWRTDTRAGRPTQTVSIPLNPGWGVDFPGVLPALVVRVSGRLNDHSSSNDAIAISWTTKRAYQNVQIVASLFPGGRGTAYLTTKIGPGTKADAVSAKADFTAPAAGTNPQPMVLFSGLTLPAGDWFLVLYGSGNQSRPGWGDLAGASIALAPGVSTKQYISASDGGSLDVAFPPNSQFQPAARPPISYEVTGTSVAVPFFAGEVALKDGSYYLEFPNGTFFGYYDHLPNTMAIHHVDLGYEYIQSDGVEGKLSMYDFTSGHWWYTSSSLFPYLYDFTLSAWIYYSPNTQNPGHYTANPRYFSNLKTGVIFTM